MVVDSSFPRRLGLGKQRGRRCLHERNIQKSKLGALCSRNQQFRLVLSLQHRNPTHDRIRRTNDQRGVPRSDICHVHSKHSRWVSNFAKGRTRLPDTTQTHDVASLAISSSRRDDPSFYGRHSLRETFQAYQENSHVALQQKRSHMPKGWGSLPHVPSGWYEKITHHRGSYQSSAHPEKGNLFIL